MCIGLGMLITYMAQSQKWKNYKLFNEENVSTHSMKEENIPMKEREREREGGWRVDGKRQRSGGG